MLILVGGYGLTGTWFVEGALGIPRRYAIQPPGTSGYSLVGSHLRDRCSHSAFSPASLSSSRSGERPGARRALRARRHMDSWTGTHYEAREPRIERAGVDGRAGSPRAGTSRSRAPSSSASALAACVVALASFFPQIVTASETSNRYHHLDHAGHFFLGADGRSD